MKKKYLLTSLAAAWLSTHVAFAQTTLAQWTFESSQPTSAGPINPEIGTGSASASGLNTISSPVGNGSAHSFSGNGWNVGDYFQFSVSTLGVQGITVSFDQAGSSTGPAQFYLAYSTDGVNFNQFGEIYTLGSTSFSSTKASTAVSHSFDLSSVTELNNVSAIYFRMVDASSTSIRGDAVGSSGTDRIDNFLVTASGAVATTGAPTIFTDVRGTNALAGRTIALSVVASGSDPLNYQWYFPNMETPLADDGTISGSTGAILTLNNVTTNLAGSYRVIISNTFGSVTSSIANLTVNTPIVTNIAYLRTLQDSANWTPTDMTNLYTVQGTVTTYVSMTSAGNSSFFIQDDTGGIDVFVAGGNVVPDAGSVVQVTGPLGQYNGLLELNLNDGNPDHLINVIDASPLPAPVQLNFSSLTDIPYMEAQEGSLVVVSNVYLGSTNSSFLASAQSVILTNLSGQTFTLYINGNESDIFYQPIPQFASSIVGVLGQYKSSAPYTSGYELLITQFGDLVPGTPLQPIPLPIPLNAHVSGNSIVLTWGDASFNLQSSTNVNGPYSDVSAAAGPTTYTDTMTNKVNFYRLFHP